MSDYEIKKTMTYIEFANFLDYFIIKDKQGNCHPINKKEILKQYKRIINLLKNTKNSNK